MASAFVKPFIKSFAGKGVPAVLPFSGAKVLLLTLNRKMQNIYVWITWNSFFGIYRFNGSFLEFDVLVVNLTVTVTNNEFVNLRF